MVLYNVDSKEEFGDCQTLGEVAGPGARVGFGIEPEKEWGGKHLWQK